MFIAALFAIAKTWRQPKCSLTEEWMKRMWCIYIHIYVYIYIHTPIQIYGIYTVPLYLYTMEYHSAIEKNEIMPFAAP